MGDRVRVTGRLQSREYQKLLLESGEYITRNAFEVSCFTLEAEQSAPDSPPTGESQEARTDAVEETSDLAVQ